MRVSSFLLSPAAAIPQSIENLIHIKHATFYRQHPGPGGDKTSSISNPPLFRDLSFELPAKPLNHSSDDTKSQQRQQQHWAVIGTSGTTTFLEILRGTHLSFPPSSRSFPYLSSQGIAEKDHRLRTPSRAIQYVGFNGGMRQGLGSGVRGAYLSARYESRREETDWSVLQYLKGETELNPSDDDGLKEGRPSDALLERVMNDLRLQKLASMPVSNLSNGQTRRSRIAKALLGKPELLLLDEPFMGLDPPTLVTLSPILRDLAYKSAPRLLMALRPQDPIPDWITHLAILGHNHTIALIGTRSDVLFALHRWTDLNDNVSNNTAGKMAAEMTERFGAPPREVGYSLSSTGISSYNAYEEAKVMTPPFFNEEGLVDDHQLSSDSRNRWINAMKTPIEHRTLKQLLSLTATAPAKLQSASAIESPERTLESRNSPATSSSKSSTHSSPILASRGEPLIELLGVEVKYGSKVVLGATIQELFPDGSPNTNSIPGLHLIVYRGSRLALLGPNGSGKTTLLSLLTSDHPHSYSLPIKFFGRTRLPTPGNPGLSLWDIQTRIGHSSPEIHSFFPPRLSIRKGLESAWADTFGAKPKMTSERKKVADAFLRWWEPELREPEYTRSNPKSGNIQSSGSGNAGTSDAGSAERTPIMQMLSQCYPPFIANARSTNFATGAMAVEENDLDWADSPNQTFGNLTFPTQRLLLLLRAVIKCPDIVVLDEAFSGLSPEVREKTMMFLEHGETHFFQRQLVVTGSQRTGNEIGETAPRLGNESHMGGDTASHFVLAKVPNLRPIVEGASKSLGFSSASNLVAQLLSSKVNQSTQEQVLEAVSAAQSMKQGQNPHQLLQDNSNNSSAASDFVFPGLTPQQALVVVSHVREEVPEFVDEWVRLPGEDEVLEEGRSVEMGKGEIRSAQGWGRVWGWSS